MEKRSYFNIEELITRINNCTSYKEVFCIKNSFSCPKEEDYKIFFAYSEGEVLFKGTENEFLEFAEDNKGREFIYDSKIDDKTFTFDKLVYVKICMNVNDKIRALIIERLLTAPELTKQDANYLVNYTMDFFTNKGISTAEILAEYVDKVFEYANFLIKYKFTQGSPERSHPEGCD